MRIEFREHPKYGTLEANVDGDTVMVKRMELFKDAGLLVVTFSGPGGVKIEEKVFRFVSREGPYALQA